MQDQIRRWDESTGLVVAELMHSLSLPPPAVCLSGHGCQQKGCRRSGSVCFWRVGDFNGDRICGGKRGARLRPFLSHGLRQLTSEKLPPILWRGELSKAPNRYLTDLASGTTQPPAGLKRDNDWTCHSPPSMPGSEIKGWALSPVCDLDFWGNTIHPTWMYYYLSCDKS